MQPYEEHELNIPFETALDQRRKEREKKEAEAAAAHPADPMLPLRRSVNRAFTDIILTSGYEVSKIMLNAFDSDGDSNDETGAKLLQAGSYISAMAKHIQDLISTFSFHEVPQEPSAEERLVSAGTAGEHVANIGRRVRFSTPDEGLLSGYGTIVNVGHLLDTGEVFYMVIQDETGHTMVMTPDNIMFID